MDDKDYQKTRTDIESTSCCVNGIQNYGVRYGYDAAFIKILPRCEGYVVVFQYNYLVDKYHHEEPKRKFEFVDTYPEALQAIKKRWNLTSEQYEKVMDILLSDYNLYQGGYLDIRDRY
jgi:hypothetical protein